MCLKEYYIREYASNIFLKCMCGRKKDEKKIKEREKETTECIWLKWSEKK